MHDAGNDPGENESSAIDRRKVLKSLGAGTATAAFGIGNVSARRRGKGSADGEIPWEFEELTGKEKLALLNDLQDTAEYETLLDIVDEQGGKVRGAPGHAKAARLTANGQTRAVVSVELETKDDREAYLNIGRDEGAGVSVANVGYSTYASDGVLQKKEIYDATAESTETASASDVSIQSTASPAVKKVVEPEATIRDAIQDAKSDDAEDPIEAQGLGDGPCDECKWAAVLICQNGCGLAGGLACGLLGITAIGGVACTTLVSVTCSLAAYYGCSETEIGEAACEQVNLC